VARASSCQLGSAASGTARARLRDEDTGRHVPECPREGYAHKEDGIVARRGILRLVRDGAEYHANVWRLRASGRHCDCEGPIQSFRGRAYRLGACDGRRRRTMRGSALLLGRVVSCGCGRGDAARVTAEGGGSQRTTMRTHGNSTSFTPKLTWMGLHGSNPPAARERCFVRVAEDTPAATAPLQFGLQSTGEGARPPARRIVQMTPVCYDCLFLGMQFLV
jgi:hypothetical protein